jgi:hypothetical protein
MMGMYDFVLPGNVKINHANLITQGQAEIKEVEEEIKGQSNSSWFVMVKR